jgi:hypothetical protein
LVGGALAALLAAVNAAIFLLLWFGLPLLRGPRAG